MCSEQKQNLIHALSDSSENSSEVRSDVCVHFLNFAFQSIASALRWAKVFDLNWSIDCCLLLLLLLFCIFLRTHTAPAHSNKSKNANQSFRQSIFQRLSRGAHANACDLSETVSDRTNNQQIWNDLKWMQEREREREKSVETKWIHFN